MPRFIWLSGPECAEMGVTLAYGMDWRVGQPLEVSDDLVERIRSNRFFREVEEADTDGDGEVSKAELMAQLDERGIDYDKRWGAKRLADLLG